MTGNPKLFLSRTGYREVDAASSDKVGHSLTAGTTLSGGSFDGSASVTFDISPTYAGQTSITELGTIATGTWEGSVISEIYGGTGQNSYSFGDILYSSATNTLSKLSGNITSAPLVLTSVGDGSSNISLSWQPLPVLGSLTYYWTNTASDVIGDFKQISSPFIGPITLSYSSVINSQLLKTFVTDPSVPNRTFIPDGQYSVHLHAAKTSGTKTTQVYAEIWEVNSSGVDIAKIVTVGPSSDLISSPAEYVISTNTGAYELVGPSSRIATKVFASISGGGSAPDISIYLSASQDSHINIPAPIVDATNFVPYLGATTDLNMGIHDAIVSNIKTGDTTNTTAVPWRLGDVVTATATIDATKYIEVMINGTLVKLAIVL